MSSEYNEKYFPRLDYFMGLMQKRLSPLLQAQTTIPDHKITMLQRKINTALLLQKYCRHLI